MMSHDAGGEIAEFRLKRFFSDGPGLAARYNLSPSYCEPLSITELLALQHGAMPEFAALSLGYPGIHGSLYLRELIAQRYAGLSAGNILVTNGADDALSLVLLSCVEPGDHVVVHAPGYQPFTALARWRGCQVSSWQAHENTGWSLDLDELEALLRPDTRLIVVNTPHNPTGYVIPAQDLTALVRLAGERGITLLSDEIYAGIDLDPDAGAPPAAALSPHAVSLSSLSKSFGLPGLRLGWIATANERVLRAASRLRLHLNTYIGAPSEFLAAIALRHSARILARNTAIARDNRAMLTAFMERHGDILTWHAPRAGVVAFPRLRGQRTADDFCRDLLEQTGILLAPGSLFDGGEQHCRLGFGVRAVPAILTILDSYLARGGGAGAIMVH